MLVIDASVLFTVLAGDNADGDRTRRRLRSERLAAPDLIDVEITSVLRGRHRGGHLSDRRAHQALEDLLAMPIRRIPGRRLVWRCWELRDDLTAYDAAYVAAAELLEAPLLTADARLARAPGIRCEVEILA